MGESMFESIFNKGNENEGRNFVISQSNDVNCISTFAAITNKVLALVPGLLFLTDNKIFMFRSEGYLSSPDGI